MYALKCFTSPAPGNIELGTALLDLPDSHELPPGDARAFTIGKDRLARFTFLGRVVGSTRRGNEKFVTVQALPEPVAAKDFSFAHAQLDGLQAAFGEQHGLPTLFWASPRRINDHPSIYVHITSATTLDTHAWGRQEPWLDPPLTFPVPELELNATVFVAAHLFRLRQEDEDSLGITTSTVSWVARASLVIRLHKPVDRAARERRDMNALMWDGVVPATDDRIPAIIIPDDAEE